jgi:hypothetical protein
MNIYLAYRLGCSLKAIFILRPKTPVVGKISHYILTGSIGGIDPQIRHIIAWTSGAY